jgi:hypothetical protein
MYTCVDDLLSLLLGEGAKKWGVRVQNLRGTQRGRVQNLRGEGAKKWGVAQSNIEQLRYTATKRHLYLRVWCRSYPVTYNRTYLRGCVRLLQTASITAAVPTGVSWAAQTKEHPRRGAPMG